MEINLAGILSLSTVDWYGKAAMVVFLRGCPLSCRFCINDKFRSGQNMVDSNYVEMKMVKALPLVGHVMLSGGEPLMQPLACVELIRKAHTLGMKMGVETSGCYPIVDGFDFTAVSIKTSLRMSSYSLRGWSEVQFDNLLRNLSNLNPRHSEARLVLFRDSEYCFSSFTAIHGIPIRVQLGVEPKPFSSKALKQFCDDLSKFMKYDLVEFNGNMGYLKPK